MKQKKTYPAKPEEVYFYGTCLVDVFYPGAGMSAIQLLRREGIRVIYPRNQTCCGQPAFNSGYWDEARKVAAAQLALFPKEIPIVIPSGSCAAMIKHHYPGLFHDDPLSDQAKNVSDRVYELTDFLVNVVKIQLKDMGSPIRVAWHTSCHALREMGVKSEPKELLAQLGNVELIELEHETECCGFGGAFSIKLPNISLDMAKDKASDVCRTGAECLLGGDCGCLMNIGGTLEHQGESIRVCHIADFLWERINE